ncbi:MAG TPA: glycosyltransferase [Terriglobia bacterium]|nr:glycosyltransferase [Terriglobia bacterium]
MIIPVYNGEKYIEEALESVLGQTFQNIEIIVVNDGSTDGTEQRVGKYTGRITYIAQTNQGQTAARRNGLNHSRGAWIAYLDCDDVWLPRKLERQVQFLEAHPEYGIVTTDVESFDKAGVTRPSLKAECNITNGHVLTELLFSNWISPSAALIKRDCFEKVANLAAEPPEYGEDWLMWLQIAAHFPVYFIDEVLVRHRVHPESISAADADWRIERFYRNLRFLQEHIPQLSARPDLIRECAFRICIKHAKYHLQSVELPMARKRLREATLYKPYNLKAWMLMGAAYTPSPILRSLKGMMKGLHKTMGKS